VDGCAVSATSSHIPPVERFIRGTGHYDQKGGGELNQGRTHLHVFTSRGCEDQLHSHYLPLGLLFSLESPLERQSCAWILVVLGSTSLIAIPVRVRGLRRSIRNLRHAARHWFSSLSLPTISFQIYPLRPRKPGCCVQSVFVERSYMFC
jgi:hypothetical protein